MHTSPRTQNIVLSSSSVQLVIICYVHWMEVIRASKNKIKSFCISGVGSGDMRW